MEKKEIKKPKPILVADDDPDCLKFVLSTLEKEWMVLSATNGDDILRIARSELPCVIVLDVMMSGGKDGFTVFNELSKDPATRNIPVIFLSNVGQSMGLPFEFADMGRYLGREPAAFLEKPVSAAELLLEVNKVIGRNM